MSKSNKLQFISAMQVIGMLLIVLSHSVSQYAEYPPGTGLFVRAIQMAGLTAFMWCSGYLLVYTESIERNGYRRYIARRAQRLLIPFVAVQILMLLPKALIARMQGTELAICIYTFLFPREGILPHLWFLPTLMILCTLAPFLQSCIETRVKACVMLSVSALISLLPGIPNLLCFDDVRCYLFWFVLGMASARHIKIDKFATASRKWAVLLTVPVYVVTISCIGYAPLKWMVCSICTIILLFYIGNLRFAEYLAGGGTLSQYTFPIYILSLPVQNVAEILTGKVKFGYIESTIVMFVGGIAVPLAIAAAVEKLETGRSLKPISKCIGL